MALTLVWTKRAEQGYARIVRYLEEEWTDKEVGNFVRETKHFFNLVAENPHILEPTGSHKNLYRGPINHLTILT
jgi:plasmid stabilization system protein ParE